jgi:energy-coupling factor transporter ATP-binding protein EcfA2
MINKLKFRASGDVDLTKTLQELNPDAEFLFSESIDGFHIKLKDFKEYIDKLNYVHVMDDVESAAISSFILVKNEYGTVTTIIKYITKNTNESIMPNKVDMLRKYDDPVLTRIIAQHYDLYEYDGSFSQKYPAITYIEVTSIDKHAEEIEALKVLVKTKGIFNASLHAEEDDNNVFIISPDARGLALKKYTIPTDTYQNNIIKDNYNDNFEQAYNVLIKFLKTDDEPGLVLFTGDPGTGKTSIINHLAGKSKELSKKFVILPSAFVGVLSDPTFLQFAVEKLRGAVLCIEDAEDILKSRDSRPDSAVSNILNVTDGILGRISNLKVICTLNNKATIDEALLRKGRLKLEYKFDKLSIDKANALAKKLGKKTILDKPVVLSDVYNADDINEFVETKKKTIGFNK